jgi:hypothetical protein
MTERKATADRLIMLGMAGVGGGAGGAEVGVRAARTGPSHRKKDVARGTPVKADSLRE